MVALSTPYTIAKIIGGFTSKQFLRRPWVQCLGDSLYLGYYINASGTESDRGLLELVFFARQRARYPYGR